MGMPLLLAVLGIALANETPESRYGVPEFMRFENGLQVVLQPSVGGSTVSTFAQLEAGWIVDPTDAQGAAHLAEHLYFRRGDGSVSVFEEARSRACRVDATTHPDATRFSMTCPLGNDAQMLTDVLDLLDGPLEGVTEAEVAVEVSVIEQELHERMSVQTVVGAALFASLLPADHPVHEHLGVPTFDAPALERADAEAYVAANYRPEKLTFAMVGPFDAAAARATLVERYGEPMGTEAVARETARRFDTPLPAERSVPTKVAYPVSLPMVSVGWNVPGGFGKSTAVGLAAEHLSASLRAALDDVLDGDSELSVVSVSCGVQSHPEASALLCTIEGGPDTDVDQLQKSVSKALLRMWERDSVKELRKALKEVSRRAPRSVLESRSAAANRARAHVFAVDAGVLPQTVEQAIEDALDWDPSGFAKVAAEWFRPERAAWVHVLPDSSPAERAVHPLPAVIAAPAVAVPTTPAAGLPEVKLAWGMLDSGLTIVAIQQLESPFVMASVRVPGGHAAHPYGLSLWGQRMTVVVDGSGRSIGTGSRLGTDFAEEYAVGPEARLSQVLDAVRARAELRFIRIGQDEEARARLEKEVRIATGRIRARGTSPRAAIALALDEALMPGHLPTRGMLLEDLEDLTEMSPEALSVWVRRTWQPAEALVVVTGPGDPEAMVSRAWKTFEDWLPIQGIPRGPYPWVDRPAEAVGGQFFVDAPASATAFADWRCRLPDDSSPELRQQLERMIERELWTELRERRGLVYTPSVSIQAWPDGSAMLRASWETAPERAGLALQTAEASLARLVQEGAEQLSAARETQARGIAHPLSSLAGREGLVADLYRRSGVVGDVLGTYAELQARVPPEAVSDALAACLDQSAWGIGGPRSAVEPSLAAVLPPDPPPPSPAVDASEVAGSEASPAAVSDEVPAPEAALPAARRLPSTVTILAGGQP